MYYKPAHPDSTSLTYSARLLTIERVILCISRNTKHNIFKRFSFYLCAFFSRARLQNLHILRSDISLLIFIIIIIIVIMRDTHTREGVFFLNIHKIGNNTKVNIIRAIAEEAYIMPISTMRV